jgi:hypothetical protein
VDTSRWEQERARLFEAWQAAKGKLFSHLDSGVRSPGVRDDGWLDEYERLRLGVEESETAYVGHVEADPRRFD